MIARVLGAAALLLIIAACRQAGPQAPPVESSPSPTPRAQPAGPGPPPMAITETGPRGAERDVGVAFASGYRVLDQQWEQLHADFEEWRAGLKRCDAGATDKALGQFASRLAQITEAASELPREPIVRELADKLIAGVEGEEEALRQLRDTWADDPEAFERVEFEQAAGSAVQREVGDGLSDLETRTMPSSQAEIGAFLAAFEKLDSTWDEFHESYDAFRALEPELRSSETARRLSLLVDEFRAVVTAVGDLPTTDVTRPVARALSQAADDEDLALRKLRGTFEIVEEDSGEEAQEDEEDLDEEGLTEGSDGGSNSSESDGSEQQSSSAELVPRYPALFGAFEAQLVESNGSRREAGHTLEDILRDVSEDSQAAISSFRQQHDSLVQGWDAFHKEYGEWRIGDGGCDRSQVTAALDGFVLRFGGLTSKVRQLPRATSLRPLGELVVEAAEREEGAYRHLRSEWRPFDSAPYEAFDQERREIGRLRRQVAIGVEDLITRYEISADELKKDGGSYP